MRVPRHCFLAILFALWAIEEPMVTSVSLRMTLVCSVWSVRNDTVCLSHHWATNNRDSNLAPLQRWPAFLIPYTLRFFVLAPNEPFILAPPPPPGVRNGRNSYRFLASLATSLLYPVASKHHIWRNFGLLYSANLFRYLEFNEVVGVEHLFYCTLLLYNYFGTFLFVCHF